VGDKVESGSEGTESGPSNLFGEERKEDGEVIIPIENVDKSAEQTTKSKKGFNGAMFAEMIQSLGSNLGGGGLPEFRTQPMFSFEIKPEHLNKKNSSIEK
jgi:hypothetical protein